MIGFQVDNQFINIAKNASLTIEGKNPLLFRNTIPGTKVYDFSALQSKPNMKKFGFPQLLNLNNRQTIYNNVTSYINNLPWQKGTIKLKEIGKSNFEFSFNSSAGDLGLFFSDKKLSDLNFIDEAVAYNTTQKYPDADYVFFPVKNPSFYGDKNPDYEGYINYYQNGALVDNSGGVNKHTRVPFPFLLSVLNQIFSEPGYTILGNWKDTIEAKSAVVFNTVSLDQLSAGTNVFKSLMNISDHLPDMKITAFLIEIQILFGLYFKINSQQKTVEIIPLNNAFENNSFKDVSRVSSERPSKIIPNQYDGVEFTQQEDSNDELSKSADWLTYREGNGKLKIQTSASTLATSFHEDSVNARNWHIPSVEMQGSGDEFELGKRKDNLRIIFFKGIEQDSLGNDYPRGHYEINDTSLRWGLQNGLVNRAYSQYLSFEQYTETIEKEIDFNIIDFLNLDLDSKIMDNHVKYLIESFSAQASQRGLSKTSVRLKRVLY
ncbi:hypothetical protein [Marivirga sp.]|uniref:hypothetical protein n=1 Tax=Marivirga sp. TaxID=2018662 RepID=UPI003DA746F1